MIVNPSAITLSDDAEAAIYAWMRGQIGDPADRVLANAITAEATTATANSGVGLRPKALLIDDEVVEVTARTGNILTITRGMLGTVAAPHDAGAKIAVLKHATVRELCGTLLTGKLREVLSIAPPIAAVLTQREARKAAEAAEQAALLAAIT
jgi:hypothetical protein